MDSAQSKRVPQVSHLLIPEPLNSERLDRAFLQQDKDRETNANLTRAMVAVHNGGIPDYFTFHGGISTQYGEDYVELYQIYDKNSEYAPLWGTRLYRSGAVTRRSIIVSYPVDGKLWLSWFEEELRGTMAYAAEVYDTYGVAVDTIRVISVLRGAEEVPLKVPGRFGMPVERIPESIDHLMVLPSRGQVLVHRDDLRGDPKGIAKEMGRLLTLRYGDGPST